MNTLPLRRHQIAWLSDAGWRGLQPGQGDAEARDCLAHWAARRLPLVVTRQVDGGEAVCLGLPAPSRWSRQRLALSVARRDVLYFDEFPLAEKALGLVPAATRPSWRSLCAHLKAAGIAARVYGSYGWQLMSGFDHVRAGSDIDLWLSVADADQADAAAAHLQSFSSDLLRLDGELLFGDGSGVAWREWLAWRSGSVKGLLVKSLHGSSLVHSPDWQAAPLLAKAA
ncbi:malonate decarboxylase holo-[acyl-carrier-protein] synthase [Ideonella sp. YS5]|uniref:malonate decarboxylase holo-[acyl-carrier-protein] synthase n=1 Tax=Ideonella sp. YS5 TaxID=3453714 RepID=UPI003EEFDC61